MKTKEKVLPIDINDEERNIIGCKALAGSSVTLISQEHKINREFVYNQKKRIKNVLEAEDHNVEAPCVVVDKKMSEKIIVGCMLICKASTEDTQRFLNWIFLIWVSIGKISNTVNEAADSRDSTTWRYNLLEKDKHQELHLESTVNDGGTGLRKGIKDAFPEVETQLDIYSTLSMTF